jgi:hypothetical protein
MTVIHNPNVQNKVIEIREVAKEALNENDAYKFGAYDTIEETFGEMQGHPYLTINHVQGIATHYNRVIVVINPAEVQRMTAVYFPFPGCHFQVSLSDWDGDRSSYHVSLNDKFNNNRSVSVERFVQNGNEVLYARLTGDLTLIDVMRIALRLSDTIAYITQNQHSRSIQMYNRNELKDYVPPEKNVIPPSPEVCENSIAALGKEISPVVNNNELNITGRKVKKKKEKKRKK